MSDKTKKNTAADPAVSKWEKALQESTKLKAEAGTRNAKSGKLLWSGAVGAIKDWMQTSDDGEELYNQTKAALGDSRKGDASKIRTVGDAVRNHGLDTKEFKSLAQAYGEARRLTETVRVEAEEDAVATEAVESIDPPKTASTVDGAAKIVLKDGLDEAARALFDALGADATGAHRALLRSFTQEVNARVKAQHDAEREAKAAEAKAMKAAKADEAKAAKGDAAPAKPTKSEKAPVAKPATEKGDAAPKAKPVVAKPATAKPATAKPATAKPVVAKAKPAVAKAKPVTKK